MPFSCRRLPWAALALALAPSVLGALAPFGVGGNGTLLDRGGSPLRIKGISWFGLETPDLAPNGLWVHPMEFYMDLLAEDHFNVLRVPFSAEWVLYNWDAYPDQGFVSQDPARRDLTAVQILDAVFDMAEARNMLVLLDLHRLNWKYISEVWYDPNDGRFTDATFLETWFRVLDRYRDRRNLWGLDLLNEPHFRATWGTDDPATDWRRFVQDAIGQIEARYPDAPWVYLVEGVEWGKQLGNAGAHPVSGRVAYVAHNYGRSIVYSINVYDVPSLHYDWDTHFGYLRAQGQSVIVGEWGGRTDLDREWMRIFVDYLGDRNMTDNFFWSLGPNSGDVAGYLLDDWTTVDAYKREVTARLQPHPHPSPAAP
jgi:endoglucanase